MAAESLKERSINDVGVLIGVEDLVVATGKENPIVDARTKRGTVVVWEVVKSGGTVVDGGKNATAVQQATTSCVVGGVRA